MAWKRKWQHTPVFLPGEFHEQRSLASYSLWGRKELGTTEQLTHIHTHKNSSSIIPHIYVKKKFRKMEGTVNSIAFSKKINPCQNCCW